MTSRSDDLVLVGAGGLAREAVSVIDAANEAGARWNLLGFVDDNSALTGSHLDSVIVLGPIDAVRDMPQASVVVATARPDNYTSRLRIVERLELEAPRYATLVHPHASLSKSTVVGHGSIVFAGVITTTSVTVGNHVVIMPGVVLTHDDVVDDYASLAAGVRLGGGVHVGTGAYLGAGALVREDVTVGAWAMVGMGSVVTRDIPPGQLWLGSPARYVRDAPVPRELVDAAVHGVSPAPDSRAASS